MKRAEVRELATKCRIKENDLRRCWHIDCCRDEEFDELVEMLSKCAKALSMPAWFSAYELRLAADAMDLLNISTADGMTLRERLDGFWRGGPIVKNAQWFAEYVSMLPNGGMQ